MKPSRNLCKRLTGRRCLTLPGKQCLRRQLNNSERRHSITLRQRHGQPVVTGCVKAVIGFQTITELLPGGKAARWPLNQPVVRKRTK